MAIYFIQADTDGLGQIKRSKLTAGGDRDKMMTAVQLFVGKPLVLAAKEQAAFYFWRGRDDSIGCCSSIDEIFAVALAKSSGSAEQ